MSVTMKTGFLAELSKTDRLSDCRLPGVLAGDIRRELLLFIEGELRQNKLLAQNIEDQIQNVMTNPQLFSASCFLRAAAIRARMFDLAGRICTMGAFFFMTALGFLFRSGISSVRTQPFTFNLSNSSNFLSTSET